MMKKTYLLIAGATLCCVPLANAAQAQTSSGIEQAVPVPQTEEPSGAGDIVVTAQRRSERLQDIPMAITALNAESFERAPVTTLIDVQTSVPNLNISLRGGSGVIAIRGRSEARRVRQEEVRPLSPRWATANYKKNNIYT